MWNSGSSSASVRQQGLTIIKHNSDAIVNDRNRTRFSHIKIYNNHSTPDKFSDLLKILYFTRVGTSIVATIYLQLIQNRYMFRSFTVLQCSHQHCVQPVVSDVEVVGYL